MVKALTGELVVGEQLPGSFNSSNSFSAKSGAYPDHASERAVRLRWDLRQPDSGERLTRAWVTCELTNLDRVLPSKHKTPICGRLKLCVQIKPIYKTWRTKLLIYSEKESNGSVRSNLNRTHPKCLKEVIGLLESLYLNPPGGRERRTKQVLRKICTYASFMRNYNSENN